MVVIKIRFVQGGLKGYECMRVSKGRELLSYRRDNLSSEKFFEGSIELLGEYMNRNPDDYLRITDTCDLDKETMTNYGKILGEHNKAVYLRRKVARLEEKLRSHT
ncbi:hypothetical protein COU61_01710 [Candidatus Pacearchaeota archaeon CG10_big_fil_rev_8_21_14_0_10_35_13]|nr:MAG: hypothetical protein COU61_01710 [Candidatus Pacearchaeota archaeon CG10_big_fil_rev_8_21_14_0_10_35_13]